MSSVYSHFCDRHAPCTARSVLSEVRRPTAISSPLSTWHGHSYEDELMNSSCKVISMQCTETLLWKSRLILLLLHSCWKDIQPQKWNEQLWSGSWCTNAWQTFCLRQCSFPLVLQPHSLRAFLSVVFFIVIFSALSPLFWCFLCPHQVDCNCWCTCAAASAAKHIFLLLGGAVFYCRLPVHAACMLSARNPEEAETSQIQCVPASNAEITLVHWLSTGPTQPTQSPLLMASN